MNDRLVKLIQSDIDDEIAAAQLLKEGGDVNFIFENTTLFELEKRTLVMLAIECKKEKILRVLLNDERINVDIKDERGRTALIYAIRYNLPKEFGMIIEKKPDINDKDPKGNTALHYAVNANSSYIVSALLPYADPAVKNKSGNNPFHEAIENRRLAVIPILATMTDVNAKNKYQETALHIATKQDNTKTLLALLALDQIDLNIKNIYGRTPIEEAVYIGSIDCLKVLLDSPKITLNADLVITLVDLAAQRGQVEILDFFNEKFPEVVQERALANQILNHPDLDFITLLCKQFNQGFGHIDYQGGLVSFAQIKAKKGEQFNGVLLKDEEFSDFLLAVKERMTLEPNECTRMSFGIVDLHWTAGYIEINAGEIKFCIIDSLGGSSKINNYIYDIIENFPELKVIYEIEDTRQISTAGCSEYVIDDNNHLSNIDKYLPKPDKKENVGFFGFLNENILSTIEFKNKYSESDTLYNVIRARLPLYLQKTTQSMKTPPTTNTGIFWVERSPKEKSLPLNKRNQTIYESLSRHVRVFDETSQNRTIEDKLDRTLQKNLFFVLNTPKTEVDSLVRSVSLEGFKEKNEELREQLAKKSRPIRNL